MTYFTLRRAMIIRTVLSAALFIVFTNVILPKQVATQELDSPQMKVSRAKKKKDSTRKKGKKNRHKNKKKNRKKDKNKAPERQSPRVSPIESLVAGITGQSFPEGQEVLTSLVTGHAINFTPGSHGGRSGGTDKAAQNERAQAMDQDDLLPNAVKLELLQDLLENGEFAKKTGYVPQSWNCSGESIAAISKKVGDFCGPGMNDDERSQLVRSLFEDKQSTSCLSGITVENGYLIAIFQTQGKSGSPRVGVQKTTEKHWSCVWDAPLGVPAGSLVPARLIEQTTKWFFTRARAQSNLVVNTGKVYFSHEDTTYQNGKEHEKKSVYNETSIYPRTPGITPYKTTACGSKPKPGCAYWQRVESKWSGKHTGECEPGNKAILAEFNELGVVAYPYRSKSEPFFEAQDAPWLMFVSFDAKMNSCDTFRHETLTVEGHDPMQCKDAEGNPCHPMCSWTEHDRTSDITAILHILHQTFPSAGKLAADLDSEYRNAACALCGVIDQQRTPPISGKCIS